MFPRWNRCTLWSSWLLAVTMSSAPGCLSCCHPVAGPAPELKGPCQALSDDCRQSVYVFFIDGLDPLSCANLKGVYKYVTDLGFTHAYLGEVYDALSFTHEICRIHRCYPEAKIALIGFDVGAETARAMAHWLKRDCVNIDLLMYIDGCLLSTGPGSRPENVWQLVNVVSRCGPSLEGAEQIDAHGAGHYGAPTHPETLAALCRELTMLAESVTVVQRERVPMLGIPPVPADEMAPTPRPVPAAPEGEPAPMPRLVPPRQTSTRGEWDFLKPVDQLQPLPEAAGSHVMIQDTSWSR